MVGLASYAERLCRNPIFQCSVKSLIPCQKMNTNLFVKTNAARTRTNNYIKHSSQYLGRFFENQNLRLSRAAKNGINNYWPITLWSLWAIQRNGEKFRGEKFRGKKKHKMAECTWEDSRVDSAWNTVCGQKRAEAEREKKLDLNLGKSLGKC